jgi:methyltransferase-like protein
MKLARAHGLEYLSESRLSAMAPTNFGAEAERALAAIATDIVELEQFMDYLRSRTFRETLLHHAGRTASYTLEPATLEGLYVTGGLVPKTPKVVLDPKVSQAFETRANFPFSSEHPLVKAALSCLAKAFPGSIRFETLVERAVEQLKLARVAGADDRDQAKDRAVLGRMLLQLFTTSDAIELWATPPDFTLTPGVRPVASGYARRQALRHEPITTRRHDSTALSDEDRAVLHRLDGTRTAGDVARSIGIRTNETEVAAAIQRLARSALLAG